jgi:hypothetical protein
MGPITLYKCLSYILLSCNIRFLFANGLPGQNEVYPAPHNGKLGRDPKMAAGDTTVGSTPKKEIVDVDSFKPRGKG